MKNNLLFPPASRWGIFLISFAVLFIMAALAIGIINAFNISPSSKILLGSFMQGLLAFILPTAITYRLTSSQPLYLSGVNICPSLRNIIGILLLYALTFPAMNQIIFYNANISLPDTWSNIENLLREWEDAGTAATQQLLADTSILGFVCNILIVGLFTGFAEEMFFRAGVQKLMILSNINKHVAVWGAAIIFSAVHFQFFGFLPRVLLGAMFGYVYLYTKSIWNAAALHALNNSLVVITSWLCAKGIVSADFDSLFVSESGFPLLMILSIAATAGFIMFFGKNFFIPNRREFNS